MAGRPPAPSLATTLAAGTADGEAGRRAGRRRPRPSRRAPVTVLNTDAANFQAMVQQFTGIPDRPFPSGDDPFISFSGGGFFRDPNNIQILHQTQPQPHHPHQFPAMSIGRGHSEAFLGAAVNSSMGLEMPADGFLLDSMPGEGGYYFS